MVSPNYLYSVSLMDNKTKIKGNIDCANKIAEITKMYLRQGLNLYDAQEKLKNTLLEKFGEDWYERSCEAVNFIIENEYANAERIALPAFDVRQYEKDRKLNVMY